MRAMLTVSLLVALAAGPAFADCSPPPDSVQIPDGSTATRDQIIAAQRAVKAYDSAVKDYGSCLQQEENAKVAAGGDKDKLNAKYAKLNNEQVDKVTKVAAKFNDELRAYKAKNSG
ncbi:MAG: hypothetical protein ACRETK_12300 [Steroidobacteraceae bacterium]